MYPKRYRHLLLTILFLNQCMKSLLKLEPKCSVVTLTFHLLIPKCIGIFLSPSCIYVWNMKVLMDRQTNPIPIGHPLYGGALKSYQMRQNLYAQRIPLETYIFILNFSLPPRSEQVSRVHVNEIKHDQSPVVIVVLDPRYDLSYKALNILYLQYTLTLPTILFTNCVSCSLFIWQLTLKIKSIFLCIQSQCYDKHSLLVLYQELSIIFVTLIFENNKYCSFAITSMWT